MIYVVIEGDILWDNCGGGEGGVGFFLCCLVEDGVVGGGG